jgi:mono/diheme cytochrome c family protein
MLRFLVGLVVGLLVGPLTLLLAGLSGRLPSAANPTPPHWEASLGARALHASLARAATGLHAPAASAADVLAGQRLYTDNCAGCHGDDRRVSIWGVAGFYPRVPQLLKTPTTLEREQMFVAIKFGVRYSGMGGWQGMMNDADIWRITAFLAQRADALRAARVGS